MLVICFFVIVAYTITRPTKFDAHVISNIIKAGISSTNQDKKNPGFPKTFKTDACAAPDKMKNESSQKPGVFFMIIVHMFNGLVLDKLIKYTEVGVKGTYKYCRESYTLQEFEDKKWIFIVINIVMWAVFGTIALTINYKLSDAKCDFKDGNIFKPLGMINIWIISDVFISMASMPCLVLKYYWDKALMVGQFTELITHVQEDSLKKFYSNDSEAKERAKERDIDAKLIKRILDKQNKLDPEFKEPEAPSEEELKKDKEYAQRERKAMNGWVMSLSDVWFNFYLSKKVMNHEGG